MSYGFWVNWPLTDPVDAARKPWCTAAAWLGQPKNGFARPCYAVWQNGNIELRSYEYPVEETVRKILAMPVPDDIRRRLANVLRSGGDPNRNRTTKETSCSKS